MSNNLCIGLAFAFHFSQPLEKDIFPFIMQLKSKSIDFIFRGEIEPKPFGSLRPSTMIVTYRSPQARFVKCDPHKLLHKLMIAILNSSLSENEINMSRATGKLSGRN